MSWAKAPAAKATTIAMDFMIVACVAKSECMSVCVGDHDADGRDILCLSQFNDSRKWVADEEIGRAHV